MAPEQLAGQPADERTDVFLLGATLYHLLTDQAPFAQGRPAQPPRKLKPWLPPALEKICLKAMSDSVEGRYPVVETMVKDLEIWFVSEPIVGPSIDALDDEQSTSSPADAANSENFISVNGEERKTSEILSFSQKLERPWTYSLRLRSESRNEGCAPALLAVLVWLLFSLVIGFLIEGPGGQVAINEEPKNVVLTQLPNGTPAKSELPQNPHLVMAQEVAQLRRQLDEMSQQLAQLRANLEKEQGQVKDAWAVARSLLTRLHEFLDKSRIENFLESLERKQKVSDEERVFLQLILWYLEEVPNISEKLPQPLEDRPRLAPLPSSQGGIASHSLREFLHTMNRWSEASPEASSASRSVILIARTLKLLGDLRRCEEVVQRAIDRRPGLWELSELWEWLGDLFYEQGRLEEAEAAYV
ncbi:MAG: hypothetical protein NZM42_15050, partial [Gemmatales bacterium]|nr:hypothetical protein [Gemmatales bacterium]